MQTILKSTIYASILALAYFVSSPLTAEDLSPDEKAKQNQQTNQPKEQISSPGVIDIPPPKP